MFKLVKASILAGFFSLIVDTRSCVYFKKSSFLAQKSVSELTSRSVPVLPSLPTKAITIPSAANLPAALLALFPKRTLKISSARALSPSASVNAFLQSIIGASVRSRRSLTMLAVISATLITP